ncbi:AAA ATPase [Mortierella alpina]|uniref:AAA ATPase n=1 Tax=Mortierella alpina TaxID=64518 RepID=A0A9P6M7C9_MORAP|nr:AAA ATPase [Mortierella alpina]
MSFLRKRVIAFPDDDDELAWPSSPSKRRSMNLSLAKSSIPARPNFADLDSDEDHDAAAGKENALRHRAATGKALVNNAQQEPQTITPPMTPTRRSPRKSLEKLDQESENRPFCHGPQQPPSTPKRRSRVLTPSSPSSSALNNSSNNSTGLTPALNRMLKPTKENSLAKPSPSDEDTVETRTKGYSTPKRLSRTRSCLEQTTLPPVAARRTPSGNVLKSEESKSSAGFAPLPLTSSSALGFYQDAKALFRRTTEPHRLVGRATERETIRNFCRNHILSATAGSLYISGQPGTGKTALLKEVMKDMESEMEDASHEIKVITINCMTVKDPRLVYQKILEALGHKAVSSDKDAVVKAVESLVLNTKSKIMYVTILDEIDQLLNKDQDVLYRLFEWSCSTKSHLTLVGIANALDMTDRFLPRLKAKNCEPQLLNFNPYQVAEIREIIMDRLFSLEGDQGTGDATGKDGKATGSRPRMAPLMQRPAIELCARKVASATGDLRKALDICRQTIEMVEMETRKKEKQQLASSVAALSEKVMPLQEISLAELENRMAGGAAAAAARLPLARSVSSGALLNENSHSAEGMTLQEAPRVTVEHVKRALASAFGSPMVQKMKALNVHQKIVLSVLVMKIQAGKTIDCEVGKVFDHYTVVCRGSNKIGAVNRGEYQDLINMLEANGLVTLGKAKEERLRKLALVPRESEVLDAIKGQDIVNTILHKAGVKLTDEQ